MYSFFTLPSQSVVSAMGREISECPDMILVSLIWVGMICVYLWS